MAENLIRLSAPANVCDICEKEYENGRPVKTKKGTIFVCMSCIRGSGEVAQCTTCNGHGLVRVRARVQTSRV
jgi:hypothetical protein